MPGLMFAVIIASLAFRTAGCKTRVEERALLTYDKNEKATVIYSRLSCPEVSQIIRSCWCRQPGKGNYQHEDNGY